MSTVASPLRSAAAAMVRAPILQRVPRSAIADLAGRGTVRRYRRGTFVFYQGDEAEDVCFLVEGRVEICSISVTGTRQLRATLETPQFFGELGVLGRLRRTATATLLEDSSVWAVPGEVFLEFLSGHFEATRALLGAFAAQIQAHEAFVEDLLFLDLKGRVAKRLLQLVSPSLDDLPADGTLLPSAVTHADLASLCGGSRENITRILSDFQRRGLIRRPDRRYVLENVAGLRRLAGI